MWKQVLVVNVVFLLLYSFSGLCLALDALQEFGLSPLGLFQDGLFALPFDQLSCSALRSFHGWVVYRFPKFAHFIANIIAISLMIGNSTDHLFIIQYHLPMRSSVSIAVSGIRWLRSEEAGTSKSSRCSLLAGSSSTRLLFLSLAMRGTILRVKM